MQTSLPVFRTTSLHFVNLRMLRLTLAQPY